MDEINAKCISVYLRWNVLRKVEKDVCVCVAQVRVALKG